MSKNTSKYAEQFTTADNLGKEALGAVTLVGVKNSAGTALDTELSDDAIKAIVGRPYLNAALEADVEYTITVEVAEAPNDCGTVSKDPDTATVKTGTLVTLTATPDTEDEEYTYAFDGWNRTGEAEAYEYESTDATYTVTATANKTYTAYFSKTAK